MARWSVRLSSGKQPVLVLATVQEVFRSMSNSMPPLFTVHFPSLQDGPETRMEQQSPSYQAKHERYYDLDMDALVSVCSRNTNVVMVWAWMLWLSYAHGTRTELCFGHGCSGERMLLEHER